MLRKLFYALTSILVLALVYHFGASTALSQSGAIIQGACVDWAGTGGTVISGVVGRTFYKYTMSGGKMQGDALGLLVPGTSPIIATSGAQPIVLLENGDIYSIRDGTQWVYEGNLIGALTPATQPTWGQLKAQYRK